MGAALQQICRRYDDRVDHPERRPPGAVPIEILLIAYPLLHLTGWPDLTADEASPPTIGHRSEHHPD